MLAGKDFSWDNFFTAAAGGAIGGAVSGGISSLGSIAGTQALHVGIDVLSNTAGQVAASVAMGDGLTAGTIISGISGGVLSGFAPRFSASGRGFIQNAVDEIGFNAARGAIIGGASSAIAAGINGEAVGPAFFEGVRVGGAYGAALTAGNIVFNGAMFELNASERVTIKRADRLLRANYGLSGSLRPTFRRGGLRESVFRTPTSLGGAIFIGNDEDFSPSGYHNTIAHELFHYNQQVQQGYGYSLIRRNIIDRFIARGRNMYTVPGTAEGDAQVFGCLIRYTFGC